MIFVYPGHLSTGLEQLRDVLARWPLAFMDSSMMENTMEEIVSSPQTMPGSGQEQEPFLYFVDVPVEEISDIQTRLEQANIQIRAMALATAENRSWTLAALMKEVQEEAAYFERRDHLADLIQGHNPMRLQMDEDYRNCFLMAAKLLQEPELSPKMLETAIQVLETLENKSPRAERKERD